MEEKQKEFNKKLTKKSLSIWKEFKKFISKGNVLDLSVAVIMGNAFSAIVTSFTKILLSVCTWGVPGGIDGLVTVLPAISNSQKGVDNIGQYFSKSELVEKTIQYAANSGVEIDASSPNFIDWQNALSELYTLHGTTYTYNESSIIDWGSFINAIITFLIIALTLFVIIRIFTFLKERKEKLQADELELYYKKHPEERPVESKKEETKPDPVVTLLTEIRDSLKKEDAPKKKKATSEEAA